MPSPLVERANTPSVLVTGISGFIAKHCAVELLRHGWRVRGTVRTFANTARIKQALDAHCDTHGLEFVAADLLDDRDWADAMHGMQAVLHVASPFPLREPDDPQTLIAPAVEGTLRVLRFARDAGVQRVVQTSSTAAMLYGHRDEDRVFTERDWTNVDGPHVGAYAQSKTLAERAARDFIEREGRGMHYASINPGFVLGPLIDGDAGSSAETIALFLRGKYPGCPRLAFPVVDVRDVARLHRLALETHEPSGGRYLAVADTATFQAMMIPIKAQLGDAARKVPTRVLPDWVVKSIALVDKAARGVLPELGRVPRVDTSATRRALRVDNFIPVEVAAPAMARSLLDLGVVKA